jgi:glycosyltransferase involved in cell wall biosynthesis
LIGRRRFRIAFFPEYFYPHIGGAETWCANIAEYLAKAGHYVEVFTYRIPGPTRNQVSSGVRIHWIGRTLAVAESGPSFTRFLIHSTHSALSLIRHGSRFDLVIGQFMPLLSLRFASRLLRIPIIAIFHDICGFESNIKQKGAPRGWIRCVLGDLLVTRLQYDGIVAVSDATKTKLQRIGCRTSDIAVVRNAVDIDLLDSVSSKRMPERICFCGRLVRHKHVGELLKAFAKVHEYEPEATLLVIGDGEERAVLEAMAHSLGIADLVRFTGIVDDREKFRLMKSCSVLVLPSTAEGWGIVITEAIFCGLRTIGYDIPALREQSRLFRSLRLVQPHSIDDLANAIRESLRTSFDSDLSSDSALVRSNFTWEKRGEEFERFLNEVVSIR